jgi:hypothetical protein
MVSYIHDVNYGGDEKDGENFVKMKLVHVIRLVTTNFVIKDDLDQDLDYHKQWLV